MDNPRSFIPRFVIEALPKAVDGYNRSRFTHNRLILMPREGHMHAEDQLWSMRGYHFLDDPRLPAGLRPRCPGDRLRLRRAVASARHLVGRRAGQPRRRRLRRVRHGPGAYGLGDLRVSGLDRPLVLPLRHIPTILPGPTTVRRTAGERMGHYADSRTRRSRRTSPSGPVSSSS